MPTGLSTQVVSATAITLTWAASADPTVAGQLTSGLAGYQVRRNGALIASPTQASYADTGLTPATLYAYTVVAVDGAGNASAPRAAVGATTVSAPDAPAPATPATR